MEIFTLLCVTYPMWQTRYSLPNWRVHSINKYQINQEHWLLVKIPITRALIGMTAHSKPELNTHHIHWFLWPTRRLWSHPICGRANTIPEYTVLCSHQSPRTDQQGINDHSIVFQELAVTPEYWRQLPRKIWLYHKTDWTAMSQYLASRLENIDNRYQPDPDDHWKQVKEAFHVKLRYNCTAAVH